MSRLRIVGVCAVLSVLGACGGGGGGGTGGGGGGGGSPPPPATYTIGGSVSGLVGSVTLQNNGGDSLTLTANGNFSFATKVSAGASYAVTVAAQPDVPDCVVSSSSGNATGNVSSVSVVCALNPATRF